MTKPSFNLNAIESYFSQGPITYKLFAADASTKQFWECRNSLNQTAILLRQNRKQDFEATIKITEFLTNAKIPVPQIYRTEPTDHLILLENIGTYHLSHAYYEKSQSYLTDYYRQATRLLTKTRQLDTSESDYAFPCYHKNYFEIQSELLIGTAASLILEKNLPKKAIQAYHALISQILNQINWDRTTFIFRDYIADNLMIKDNTVHLIDFQDAGIGPVGYDFISLTEDARYDVPPMIARNCENIYLSSLSQQDLAVYEAQKDYLKVIRHLRILSNFIALSSQGKPGYLKYIPRILTYLDHLFEKDHFSDLKNWFDTYLPFTIIHAFIKRNRPIDQAMILAAGYGKRMRPLTDHTPKPLLPLNGKPILDYLCDQLTQNKFTQLFINGHHLADQVKAYVQEQKNLRRFQLVSYSHEDKILETGGGVQKMCQFLSDKEAPFFVLNGDLYYDPVPDQPSLFDHMRKAWDPEKMDVLLWLIPKDNALFVEGKGDYLIDKNNRLTRNLTQEEAPLFYAGIQITSPHLYPNTTEDRCFSNLEIWDKAQAANRLYGIIYEADWFHIGTPETLAQTENLILQKHKAA